MMENGEVNSTFAFEPDPPTPTQDHPAIGNMDLMDDFFHISQYVKMCLLLIKLILIHVKSDFCSDQGVHPINK